MLQRLQERSQRGEARPVKRRTFDDVLSQAGTELLEQPWRMCESRRHARRRHVGDRERSAIGRRVADRHVDQPHLEAGGHEEVPHGLHPHVADTDHAAPNLPGLPLPEVEHTVRARSGAGRERRPGRRRHRRHHRPQRRSRAFRRQPPEVRHQPALHPVIEEAEGASVQAYHQHARPAVGPSDRHAISGFHPLALHAVHHPFAPAPRAPTPRARRPRYRPARRGSGVAAPGCRLSCCNPIELATCARAVQRYPISRRRASTCRASSSL